MGFMIVPIFLSRCSARLTEEEEEEGVYGKAGHGGCLAVDADTDTDSGHGQKQACSHEYHDD